MKIYSRDYDNPIQKIKDDEKRSNKKVWLSKPPKRISDADADAYARNFNPVKVKGRPNRASIRAVEQGLNRLRKNDFQLDAPYRVIAMFSGVSIRTVGRVINFLKRCGRVWVKHQYIVKDGQSMRVASLITLRGLKNLYDTKLGNINYILCHVYDISASKVSQLILSNMESEKWGFARDYYSDLLNPVEDVKQFKGF